MTRTDGYRRVGSDVLAWAVSALLLALGAPLVGWGLLGVRTSLGQGFLCLGLVLVVCGAGVVGGQLVEQRIRRQPPQARLTVLSGVPALHLPRDPGPTLVSSWILAGLGAVAALRGVFVAGDGRWVGAALMLAAAGLLLWCSAVQRGGSFAGGLWFTPAGLRHEDRGIAVDLPWEAVTGVVPQQPMPVLVRSDHTPVLTRTGPRGRASRPITKDGTLVVDTRHLAGGAVLASYVIGKAVTDPASREVLGTPESLPPVDAAI